MEDYSDYEVFFLLCRYSLISVGIYYDGIVVGVEKIDEILRKISDVITAQIEPNPQDEISSELKFDEGKTIIAINILKGNKNIY